MKGGAMNQGTYNFCIGRKSNNATEGEKSAGVGEKPDAIRFLSEGGTEGLRFRFNS